MKAMMVLGDVSERLGVICLVDAFGTGLYSSDALGKLV